MAGTISQRQVDQRRLITPEGIDLQVQLSDIGSRIGAYVIDQIIIYATLFAALFVIVFGGIAAAGEVVIMIFILVSFFLRNFYYMFFEMGRKAATPGKRICKIRVASRTEARLTANAVFARNALREIEINLPLSFLAMGGELASEKADLDTAFTFTPEQLETYGVHELHVLENVIRANEPQTVTDVSDRIRNKIKWQKGLSENDLDFLKAFYASLRGRLETRLLFGVRRKDKFDKT